MNPYSTKRLADLQAAMAKNYGVSHTEKTFSVTEPLAVRLNDAIQTSSSFLKQINVLPVTERSGNAIGIGVQGFVARRTNTKSKKRAARNVSEVNELEYKCAKTEWDVAMDYDTIDALARFANFYKRYLNIVYQQVSLDRIRVGFYGQSVALETDTDANPNGEDVNIGWLKLLVDNNAAQYLTEGAVTDKISIGANGDYKNVDALAYDVYAAIPAAHRTGNEVCIIGERLVSYDMNKAMNVIGQKPSEQKDAIVLDRTYGGRPEIIVPGFHDTGCMVTDLNNLSLYYQESGTRRKSEDQPDQDQVAEYTSSNDAYVLESVKGLAAIEAGNIVLDPAES